jgi:hypothetical protein
MQSPHVVIRFAEGADAAVLEEIRAAGSAPSPRHCAQSLAMFLRYCQAPRTHQGS